MKKQMPICRECGSPEVRADAWATWDVETQEWEVDFVSDDKGAHCPDCDGETRIKWVPYVGPTDAE